MVLWEMATSVDKKKMAPTVFLTLTGKAREAVLEMNADELNAEDGMTKLYAKLDELLKEGKTQASLICYDKFERYVRPSEMSIADYLVEFERMNEQLKTYDISLPEPVLAHRALRSANISDEYERIVKATVTELTFKGMATQLKKLCWEPAKIQLQRTLWEYRLKRNLSHIPKKEQLQNLRKSVSAMMGVKKCFMEDGQEINVEEAHTEEEEEDMVGEGQDRIGVTNHAFHILRKKQILLVKTANRQHVIIVVLLLIGLGIVRKKQMNRMMLHMTQILFLCLIAGNVKMC